MGLYAPSPEFAWSNSNTYALRPAAAFGTSFVPGASNVKGSWTSILTGTDVARDVFGLLINFNSVAVSAQRKSCLVDIGVDPSGGTSYTILIADLEAGSAGPYNIGNGGKWYYFPIWIKAGSRVGCRGQVNNATAGTVRVGMTIYGSPRDKSTVRVGTRVETLGVDYAISGGVNIGYGTTSEGTFVSLGTLTRNAWYFQQGFGIDNSLITALVWHTDLGIGNGTNFKVACRDKMTTGTTTEQLFSNLQAGGDCYVNGYAGEGVYGRCQCSGVPDSGQTMLAYCVGG